VVMAVCSGPFLADPKGAQDLVPALCEGEPRRKLGIAGMAAAVTRLSAQLFYRVYLAA
jgi:hypothetical protein